MKRSLKRACKAQLTQRFGLSAYRPGQKAALCALLSGRDLLCLLPTGAGKSLCWQLPALVHPGLTVVVSPLISLMRDQVMQLTAHGIPALSLDSLMQQEERAASMEKLRAGAVRIVFVSPERLLTPAFQQLCREIEPWLLVIDEAHCVVQWGRDFRPAYSRISDFAASLPVRPVLCAMTATADRRLQKQLIEVLPMVRPRRVVLPVLRENLHYQVRTALDTTRELLRILPQAQGKTVIFCRTRARTETLAARLNAAGFAARHYHAGLSRQEREEVQDCFVKGVACILTATTAFGMGIDIPDVRTVIHDHLPENIIDYVQQSGRAGRDRQSADCILLLDPAEILRISRQVYGISYRLRRHPVRRHRALKAFWRPRQRLMAVCLTSPCIQQGIAEAFGQHAAPCGVCSACCKGPLLEKLPNFPSMQPWQVRAWLLRWQRGAIAKQRDTEPAAILTEAEILHAARTFLLPASAPMEAKALQPLLRCMQRTETYQTGETGTY